VTSDLGDIPIYSRTTPPEGMLPSNFVAYIIESTQIIVPNRLCHHRHQAQPHKIQDRLYQWMLSIIIEYCSFHCSLVPVDRRVKYF
jgi:hypothetical protein